ncbi:unnamed protein product, partial [Scytosiphon promiscuus]
MRAVSGGGGGGGVDAGTDSASGQVDSKNNASVMAQAAAGPAAAVAQAVDDSPAAASSSSMGQAQKRELHGDKEYTGQGCPKPCKTSAAEPLGTTGLREAESDECWSRPKRRDIEG